MKKINYPEKYNSLLDEETWAFIEHTNACYPEKTVDFTIERQREIYDALCIKFFAGYPDGVSAKDSVIKAADHDLAIRSYVLENVEPAAIVVYCHGGGYIVGGLESHDDVCAEICAGTGFSVISIDYRLSPEHAHPAAYQDALAGFEYAADLNDLPIIMAGDSAGANLVAAVCHTMRKHARKPIGQALFYPGFGGDLTKGSYVEHADAPLMNFKDISFYTGIRAGGQDFSNDATYAPLADRDFSGLPPTFIASAQCDPIRDDGREYCKRVKAAGGQAIWFEEEGLIHGYLRARHSVKKAQESFERVLSAISMMGRGNWEY